MVESGATEAEVARQRELMQEELDNVPLSAVPGGKRKKKEKPDERAEVVLMNEKGIPAGKFGWCVACRGTAGLYCKHTRHPVCSFECKQAHIKLLEEAAA